MDNRKGPLDWMAKLIKQLFTTEQNNKRNYFIILFFIGILLMVVSSFFSNNKEQKEIETVLQTSEKKETLSNQTMREFEKQYEKELQLALEEIMGVEDVTVIITVEATEKKVFEKNTNLKNQVTNEEDSNGKSKQVEDQSHDEQIVLTREGDKEVPIVQEIRKPEISGVLVVAKGVENIQVKKWMIEAVTRVLNVPNYKVAVIPKKTEGDV